MFLRKKRNASGSTSIQIIQKNQGLYKVVKTIGSSKNEQQLQKLWFIGKQEIDRLSAQASMFTSENDTLVEQIFDALENASICTVRPGIIFGTIYDYIGFNAIYSLHYRHLVLARLAFPLSKLKPSNTCIAFKA